MKNGSGVEADRISTWGGQPPTGEIFKVHTSGWKRAMDLAIAFPVLVFTSPLLILIYCLLKVFDPGPALFTQLRVGRDGQTFLVYKFRTMRADASARLVALLASDPAAAAEWSKFQKLRNDPRITVLGRFLRRTSLDELPQLLNIMRGEMSVVGPRAADDDHGDAVAPGVEDGHAGVLQADDVVHGRGQRHAGGARVAVGDGDGDLLVTGDHHLGHERVAEVDQRIVDASVAGPGVEGDVGDPELAQQLDHEVRPVLGLAGPSSTPRSHLRVQLLH
jgi:lipopolysaccharide/colanic/teichoic acid biosynthesis glycosyltransferase